MLTEATAAEAIEHLEISSVDATSEKDDEKDDDPFWSLISQEKDDEAHTYCEPPRASHGFGLLPYVTRRKRYKGCVPQPDDFTPDSLRLTPSGCGVLPSRPFTPPIETVPEKDNTTLLCENNEGLEDTVVSESENISVACTWGSDSSTADSPSDSLEETLCHATFRKEFVKQAKLFSEKCKAKNFRIDEVSTIDSFLHRLHDLVSQTNEKFEQIKASSVKHNGDDPDFFSTIFASQPFLNVKRGSNVVDLCFNTFLVYPRQSKETISRKNFDGYVKNVQERLRTKEEFVYFRPQSVCEADTTTTTTASQIASQDGEDEYLVEESCAEANLSNEMPKLFVEGPLSAPQSPDRSSESPPSNALFSEKVEVAEEIPKSDEHDVLLGILTAMDECGGPARSRTTFESEFDEIPALEDTNDYSFQDYGPPKPKRMREDDDQTIPPISGCSSQSVSPCEIPSPNLSNGDEKQTSCPSLPKSSAKDEVSPDSSQEPLARLASPSAIRAFRASLHGDLLPNVNDFPNNIKKPPTDGVKRETVNYGDDPFLYTSTGAVKKPMLRPVKRPKLYSAQAADAEDPYALYVKNESNKSGERPSDPSQAAQYDVFRTTFSSLKDRAACSLAAFNLNKPRVKWRLVPVSRAKIKATRSPNSLPPVGVDPRSAASSRSMDKNTQDPSSSGQTENVECGISGNLNSKNFRKVPVRCMSETASAIARPRLLLRPHCRRLSYKPNLMLNWRTQCEWNKQSELDPMEMELIMKNVIPKWGSANPNRAVFPFGKVEGIFWPVVQPHDAIDLNDEDQVTSADTKNQLVCLSEMTFALRRQLLCGRDDQFHYKRYMEAAENENWQGGRFEHRIGYQRVFATQTIQEARQKDQEMQQKEAAWMQRLVELNTTNLSQSSEDSSHYQKAFQPNSLDMTRHIDFNLSDEYSRARDVASTKPEHFHLCKGRRPPLKVPRQWLEVDIDDYMPVSQRKDYLCSYINYRNTLTFEHEPMAGDSSRTDEMEQYHLSAIKAIFIHQSGHKAMGMKSSLPNDIQAKANKRLEDVSRELASESVSLSTLIKLCELQNWEERYWTIIWDNLAASYKHAAPVSQLELDTFIHRAFENAANVYQRHEYCQRFWYAVDKVVAL